MTLSTFPATGRGQGVYLPRFMTMTAALLHISNSSYATWLYIIDDADRALFEANANAAAARAVRSLWALLRICSHLTARARRTIRRGRSRTCQP